MFTPSTNSPPGGLTEINWSSVLILFLAVLAGSMLSALLITMATGGRNPNRQAVPAISPTRAVRRPARPLTPRTIYVPAAATDEPDDDDEPEAEDDAS